MILNHKQILEQYQRTHKASSFKQFESVTASTVFTHQDMLDDDTFINKAVEVYSKYKPSTMQSKLGHWITYYKIAGLDEQRVIELRSLIKLGIQLEKTTPNPNMTLEEAKRRLFQNYEKENRKDIKLLLLFYSTNVPLRLIVLNNTIIVSSSSLYERLMDKTDKNFINLETNIFVINEDKTFAREFKIESKVFIEALHKYLGKNEWIHFDSSSESTQKRALASAVGSRPIQTLRHLYISHLVEQGVSKRVFQEETTKMGHSMETALNEYATNQKIGFLSN